MFFGQKYNQYSKQTKILFLFKVISMLAKGIFLLATLFYTGCSAKFNNAVKSSANSETVVQETIPQRLLFGQDTFSDWLEGERGITDVKGVASDGTRLFVTDFYWNKIMIYNSIPTQDFAASNIVLGKSGPKSVAPCKPEGVSAANFGSANRLHVDNGRLYLSDTANNRVLIWKTIPTQHCTPADIVLGQADFYSHFPNRNQTNPAANTLNGPYGILTIGNKLLVADYTNNRVLIWNDKNTLTNGASADVVLGQTSFTSNTANSPSRSGATASGPINMGTDGTKLIIADRNNNRVLIFNTVPTSSGTAANFVIGQTSLTAGTSNSGGISASSTRLPYDAKVAQDGRLYVADGGNHRILIWNTIPSANKANANLVLGQTSFTASSANQGSTSASATSLSNPTSIALDSQHLFVTDEDNNRVLIWDRHPTSSTTPADHVVGQLALTPYNQSGGAEMSASRGFYAMQGVIIGGGKLIAFGNSQNRVLVWNQVPTTSNTPADLVLGQPDFTSYVVNNNGAGVSAVSAKSLWSPVGGWTDGNRLAISDYNNNRVLIWNHFPKESFTPADIVLGQATMTTNTAGAVSATSLKNPSSIVSDGTRFIVLDKSNHRILIWNNFPTMSNTPADVVLGQPDMVTGTANTGGRSAKTLSGPFSIWLESGKLLVTDFSNMRVLIWNSIPKVSNTPADVVLGQPDFTSVQHIPGSDNHLKEMSPLAITVDQGRLYLTSDGLDGKIMVWNSIPTQNNTPADWIYGAIQNGLISEPSEYTFSQSYRFAIANNMIFNTEYRLSRMTAMPIRPVGFYSNPETTSSSGKLTMVSCSDISHVFVNEGERPSAFADGWQDCSTTPGAISFKLEKGTEGLHIIKVWMKKSMTEVKSDPISLSIYLDTTVPNPPTVILTSSNPATTSDINLTIGHCNGSTYSAVTETPNPPKAEDSVWQFCTTASGGTSYTLSNATAGVRSLYVWGKHRNGNVSATANSLSVTYSP